MNFFIEIAVTLFDKVAPGDAVAQLYEDYVEEPSAKAHDGLEDRVKEVFKFAGITPTPYSFTIKYGDVLAPVDFSYGYVNGQRHLMDRINLTQGERIASRDVHDFTWRAEMAEKTKVSRSFIALAQLPQGEDAKIEPVLRLLNERAHLIDISSVPEGARNLRQAIDAH
ncbi:hypothetical protein C1I92_03620 [Jiangella anatolica]|uniref:Uncharacterized protein n=1 Tax=Jiangella anatolica TaxID=2670374 RepID=A0A2W2C0U1_9ACTN|nr:hypothetical protein C1I92_03620 [Jiangella anatolica]